MMKWLALLLVLALPIAADASTGWKKTQASGSPTTTRITGEQASQGGQAFLHIDSTSTEGSFSNALAAFPYRNLEFVLIPEANQTTDIPTCEVRVWATTATGGTAITTSDGFTQVSADIDGDGIQDDATLDGVSANRRSMRFAAAPSITVEIVDAPRTGEQCFLWVSGSL